MLYASAMNFAHRPDMMRQRLSDGIAVARVLCILGVVYVHAWTGPVGAGDGWQDVLRWTLMDGLGRSAVPLLGLISGWLVAGSSRTGRWWPFVRNKARLILLPMVLWNGLALLIVCLAAHFFGLSAPPPPSFAWVVQELLILSRNPDINVQMPFLRDLFLCMVAAPLLVRLPNRMLALVMAAAALCALFGLGPPVLMRVSILAFFTGGMLVRRTGLERRIVAWPAGWTLMPFLLLMPVRLALRFLDAVDWAHHGPAIAALDLMTRVAAALAFWRIAWAIAGSAAAPSLLRLERYMFFMFCSHLIALWTLAPLIGGMTGSIGAPVYPLFLLAQPLLVLGFTIVLAKVLEAFWPQAAAVLSGGRLEGFPKRPSRLVLQAA